MRLPFIALALLPAALATPTLTPSTRPSPFLKSRSSLPGKYIVKFKDATTDISLNSALTSHKPDHVFRAPGFKGFSATLDATSLATIRALPDVDFVEEDSIVSINGVIAQDGAPWNLARLSSRTWTTREDTYRYDESAGAGTCVYVVDTGVDGTHPDLAGRVVWGVNTAGDNKSTDGNGHGTAVAGVAAGIVHGVAKRSTVVVVKVLDSGGSGTASGVIAGLSFIATDSATRANCPNGTVANISLGGGRSTAINAAAAALVNSGVFVSVAAGGSNDDVHFYSPASEPLVFTVGAIDANDAKSGSSNYGEGVDVFAPGVNILAPWIGGSVNTLSGTSFSAAHVSGLAAYFLGLKPDTPVPDLGEFIKGIATQNLITGLPMGTKNLLAYNGIDL